MGIRELRRSVLTCKLMNKLRAPRVFVCKLGEVVDFAVHDAPAALMAEAAAHDESAAPSQQVGRGVTWKAD